jgi:hypothetical protein
VTVPKDRGRDLLQCNDERAGVMSELVGQPGITFTHLFNHSRHRRTELDSCCLIQEDTGPIRFGTMINDYREVVAVLKDRGRVLPASNWSI